MTRCTRYTRAILAATLLLGLPGDGAPTASAQGGALTFGALLLFGTDKIKEVIREAQEAGRGVAITAGIQAQNTVSQAGVVYQDVLNKTFDQLDEQQKKAYRDLRSLIAQFEQGAQKVTAETGQRAQLIANTLPLAKRYPQLVRATPTYAVPGIAVHRVRLEGNFPYAFTSTTTPSMIIGRNRLSAVQYDNFGITFEVPVTLLNKAPVNGIGHTQAVILVPWDNSRFYQFGPFRKIEDARYAFDLPVLPSSAAKIDLVSQIDDQQEERSTRYSEVWYFDSEKDDQERTMCYTLSEADRTDGWRIIGNEVAGEVTQVVEGEENSDWYNRGQQDTNDITACWRFRTEHHAWDDDGKIRWRIRANVKRTVVRKKPEVETATLGWSTSRILAPKSADWKLRLTRFDGKVIEYSGTDLSNDLIQVDAGAGRITLRTYGSQ